MALSGVPRVMWLLLLPALCEALASWPDGTWYDCPKDLNVGVPICKMGAEALPPACPSGWEYFNSSCYTLVPRFAEWREAVEICSELHGSFLTSITSADENKFVRNICGARICWLGMHEHHGLEGIWQWLDGKPATYWNWHQGEPSNFGGLDENVMVMNFGWKQLKRMEQMGAWADGNWHSVSGDFNKPSPICKRGVVSQGKARYCADGWEEHGESCYKLFDWNCSHTEARAVCKQQRAFVVSIGSEEEQVFVRTLCGPRMCWLGLQQRPESKTWVWDDGSAMLFASWGRGEPSTYNNGVGPGPAVMMNFDITWAHGKGGRWRDPLKGTLREAVLHGALAWKEHQAAKFRLGTIGLGVVAYMGVYIARLCLGHRAPGGPATAGATVLLIVLAGSLADRMIEHHAGALFLLLLGAAAGQAAYLVGLRAGLWKGHLPADREDARRVPITELE